MSYTTLVVYVNVGVHVNLRVGASHARIRRPRRHHLQDSITKVTSQQPAATKDSKCLTIYSLGTFWFSFFWPIRFIGTVAHISRCRLKRKGSTQSRPQPFRADRISLVLRHQRGNGSAS